MKRSFHVESPIVDSDKRCKVEVKIPELESIPILPEPEELEHVQPPVPPVGIAAPQMKAKNVMKVKNVRKKRLPCPTTTEIDPRSITASDFKKAITMFEAGAEVVLLPLSTNLPEMKTHVLNAMKKDLPSVFSWYNDCVKPKFKVPDPTVDMMMVPGCHTNKWQPYFAKGKVLQPGGDTKFSVPGIAGGMVNLYNSHLSNYFLGNGVINELFTKLTGTKEWQVHSNRMRLVTGLTGIKNDNIHALHWETHGTKLGFILPVSEQRSFVFYEGTSNLEDPYISTYLKKMGNTPFISIPDQDAHTQPFLDGRRRRVIIPFGHILLWNHHVAHEICRFTPSTSLFMSPYNPKDDEQKFFYSSTSVPRNPYYHAPQQMGLNPRDSEIFGVFFGLPGNFWPSKKETFAFCHQQAMYTSVKRVIDKMTRPNAKGDPNRNVQYLLSDYGKFDHRAEKDALEKSGMDNIPYEVYAEGVPLATRDVLDLYGSEEMLQYRIGLRKEFPSK